MAKPILNVIQYTATAKIEKNFTLSTFGANVVSHEWDNVTGEGVITFDADVTKIGTSSFNSCDSLTSIIIPDSVTTIGGSAFRTCTNLTSITIPNGVTEIVNYAFEGCRSLTSVTIGDNVTTIWDYAFQNCNSLTSIIIGKRVTSIGKYAFRDCISLTSVTIPDSVTTIGDYSFRECTNLTSVTIGGSVTTIGSSAFRDCISLTEFNGKFASEDGRCLIVDGALHSFAPAGLTSYTIPDGITKIESSAFNSCDSLTSITIPDSVTTIGNSAFYNCTSLTSVYCEATTPPSLGGSRVFDDNASDRTIYVPAASVEAYKSATRWSEYEKYITSL